MLFHRFVRFPGFQHSPVIALILLSQFPLERSQSRFCQLFPPTSFQHPAKLLIRESNRSCRSLRRMFCGRVSTSEWYSASNAELFPPPSVVGDIFHGAFVIEEASLRITNRPAVLRNPGSPFRPCDKSRIRKPLSYHAPASVRQNRLAAFLYIKPSPMSVKFCINSRGPINQNAC